VKIGYSYWGFLGPGVLDTPDGGRSHRRTLLDGLRARGHELVLLQGNRDLNEAGDDYTTTYTWDPGLPPEVDALFLEWRWPIPGRNTTPCGSPGHTCDLHRQHQLLAGYTARGVPTVLWDKDQQLPASDPLRRHPTVRVLEPALHPHPGSTSLLFPVADTALDHALTTVHDLAELPRDLPLVYIGNQYDRDDAFTRYLAPAAAQIRHRIAGKWPDTSRWPDLTFTGRIPLPDGDPLDRGATTTVLLLPDRYAAVGQMTQRLFEAVLAGCLPITPASIRGAARFTPPDLHAADGRQVADLIRRLHSIAGTADHAALIRACLQRLDLFRLSAQLDTLDHVLATLR
jgi:hypothetical protein